MPTLIISTLQHWSVAPLAGQGQQTISSVWTAMFQFGFFLLSRFLSLNKTMWMLHKMNISILEWRLLLPKVFHFRHVVVMFYWNESHESQIWAYEEVFLLLFLSGIQFRIHVNDVDCGIRPIGIYLQTCLSTDWCKSRYIHTILWYKIEL